MEKEEIDKNFWQIFFSTILSYIEHNDLKDSIDFINIQIDNLEDLKMNHKKQFLISDFELDQIIKTSIIYDNNLYHIKRDLDKKYNYFIPILNYQLYINQLEQLIALIEERDIKGLKFVLKKYLEIENIILQNSYNL